MGRPIDADKTIEKLDCLLKETNVKCLDFMIIEYNHAVADSIAVVKGQPTIDAVEVIRCQDCIWWDTKHPYGTLVPNAYHCKANDRFYSAEHFCAYGERRE